MSLFGWRHSSRETLRRPKDLTTDGTCLYVADGKNGSVYRVTIADGSSMRLPVEVVDPDKREYNSVAGITTDGKRLYLGVPHMIKQIE
jgi:hypothetical protein